MRFQGYIIISEDAAEDPAARDACVMLAKRDMLKAVASAGMKRYSDIEVRTGYVDDDFIKRQFTVVLRCDASRVPRIINKRRRKDLLKTPKRIIRYFKMHNWAR